jgi:NitT/TauT family transport system permease protein
MLSGDALSVFIGVLMVMPIIWQNTIDAYSSIDKNLIEVAEIFEFSNKKKFALLIYPTLKSFLYPAIITSAGLAWKAEIAAEIIAYTKKSIGQGINDAKYNMDTPTVFAWTILIITFSIILEIATKKLLRRFK